MIKITQTIHIVETQKVLDLLAAEKFYQEYLQALTLVSNAIDAETKKAEAVGNKILQLRLLNEQVELASFRISVLERQTEILDQLKKELP